MIIPTRCFSCGKPIGQLWEEYQPYSQLRKTTSSYRGSLSHVKALLEVWENRFADTIVSRDVILAQNKWMNSGTKTKNPRPLSKKTVNNRCILLSAILRYGLDNGYIRKMPEIKQLTIDTAPPKYFKADEVEVIITMLKPFVKDYAFILLHTGMRSGELKRLEWVHVDLKSRKLLIHEAKSHKFRSIPINADLFEHLSAMKRQSYKGQKYVIEAQTVKGQMVNDFYNPFVGELKKFGLTGNVHMLRHTFASRLVQAGVSIFKVSKLLGHADVKTTMIYAHLAPEDLLSAVSKLEKPKQNAFYGMKTESCKILELQRA